jgi:dTDP-4-dehydrorhamnose reductase
MKILLIGITGQLGSDLAKSFQKRGLDVCGATHAELDVCEHGAVSAAIESLRPDVVVNTSAFHKVELCAQDPRKALEVNALAARNLAQCCDAAQAMLVHFSTDYVFDGKASVPYDEFDRASPVNVYGVSKLTGEQMIMMETDRCLILRTSGLYGVKGSSGKGGNFVEMMLGKAQRREQIRVVMDQILSPTCTADLAETVTQCIEARLCGLFHASSEGETSWYDFTRRIVELAGLETEILPVKTGEFASPVMRPAYSVLSKLRLKRAGINPPPHWADSLAAYLWRRNRTEPSAPSVSWSAKSAGRTS